MRSRREGRRQNEKKSYKLTERRSGLYPRLAIAEVILKARRLPDRGRMVDVALADATSWEVAFVLRVTIFTPEAESEISMTFVQIQILNRNRKRND